MIVGLFGKTIGRENVPFVQHLIEKLESAGIGLMVYEPFYAILKESLHFEHEITTFNDHKEIKDQVNFLISVGGDGILLGTITLVRDSGIPILGVNIGKMGFLSSVSKENIPMAIDALVRGTYALEQRTMIRLDKPDLFGNLNYALNELCIYKKDPLSMIVVSVYINDYLLNSYWADGLIIATPTGSTAYSLSCGGPIVVPGSENFIITPIATHNLTVRPIVIPDKHTIRIKVEGRQKDFFVSLDARFRMADSSMELLVMKEDFKINLVRLENENFYKTIREKLNWGIDIRN
jgi:NAD+ kinase